MNLQSVTSILPWDYYRVLDTDGEPLDVRVSEDGVMRTWPGNADLITVSPRRPVTPEALERLQSVSGQVNERPRECASAFEEEHDRCSTCGSARVRGACSARHPAASQTVPGPRRG